MKRPPSVPWVAIGGGNWTADLKTRSRSSLAARQPRRLHATAPFVSHLQSQRHTVSPAAECGVVPALLHSRWAATAVSTRGAWHVRGLTTGLAATARGIHVNVDVLTTPNENAVKLLPGCDVTGQVRTVSLRRKDLVAADTECPKLQRLAQQLLDIAGVSSLLFGFDFITLVKDDCAEWEAIQDEAVRVVEAAARIALLEGQAMAPLDGALARLRSLQPTLQRDGEVVANVIALLEEKVVPNVQADGGDVEFRGFSDGVVWISMVGSCASCASSTVTVRFMIKNLLTHYVEGVTDVRAIGEDEDLALELAPSTTDTAKSEA